MAQNVNNFKKKWSKTFVKAGSIYSQRKSRPLKEIISVSKEQLDEMGIKSIKLAK
jgi:hypothetical protein